MREFPPKIRLLASTATTQDLFTFAGGLRQMNRRYATERCHDRSRGAKNQDSD
jgi:hypothetical protein